jgi:septum formation protein
VLAADTVVALGRRVLPKAETIEQASDCIRLLSGRAHRVYTSVCLVRAGSAAQLRVTEARVRFKSLSEAEIRAYLNSHEWQGKAGGYGIQGIAGSFLVKMTGSYSAIVGLPLYETAAMLAGANYPLPPLWAARA